MIDSHMTESVGDKTFITTEFIRVNKTATFHFFDRHLKQSFSIDIPYRFNPYFYPALEDAEYRDLPGSSLATVSFSSPAKVGFIHLGLTEEYE
jgi:hypothetical protein